MPVLDHPISDKVKHSKPPAGCFNRGEFKDGYWAKDGFYADLVMTGSQPTITQKVVFVPHSMSTKCRQINTLPECVDCQAEKDQDYIDRMKNL